RRRWSGPDCRESPVPPLDDAASDRFVTPPSLRCRFPGATLRPTALLVTSPHGLLPSGASTHATVSTCPRDLRRRRAEPRAPRARSDAPRGPPPGPGRAGGAARGWARPEGPIVLRGRHEPSLTPRAGAPRRVRAQRRQEGERLLRGRRIPPRGPRGRRLRDP